ncbi:MAG: hypothetical protein KKA07_12945 [Bacteroidetes bacterium]|nr:hypothetical protein [Bacteroidota bacterium]MBU1719965.1 hypothetical protein [Bacteroidota bacterium]
MSLLSIAINGIEAITLPKHYYYLRAIPFCLIIIVYQIHYREQLLRFFRILLVFSLVFFIFNLPIILEQYGKLPSRWGEGTLEDQVTGLYGKWGTQLMSLSWLMLLFLIRYFWRGPSLVLYAYLVTMVYLARLCESKAFFFFAFFFILISGFYERTKNLAKRVRVFLVTAFFGVLGVWVLYTNSPGFEKYVNVNILSIVENRVSSDAELIDVQSSREQTIATLFSENKFFYGSGIGSASHVFFLEGSQKSSENVEWYKMHYDMTLIWEESGLVFFLVLMFLYAIIFDNFFESASTFRFWLVFLTLLFITYYTHPFSDPRKMVPYVLIIITVASFGKRDKLVGLFSMRIKRE